MEQGLMLASVIVLTATLIGVGALMILGALTPDWRRDVPIGDADRHDAVFLFDQGRLIDASAQGARLLDTLIQADQTQRKDQAWPALSAYLAQRFPDFDCAATWPGHDADWTMHTADGELELTQEWIRGSLRLTLHQRGDKQGVVVLDRLSHNAMMQELDAIRQALDLAPSAIWAENDKGRVTWANGAYLRLLCRAQPDIPLVWPLPRLFDAPPSAEHARTALTLASGHRLWFDLHMQDSPAGRLYFAQPADLAQHAEESRQQFIQTLTRTFATLPTGLAVFDKTRRLTVFNPALSDLTRLEPEFLLSCPGIEGFLNRLREKRTLPEPRDYQAWSRRLLDIERAATGVDFQEDWLLSDGRVLHVSARPHPDGALAILFEDTSANSALTRQARAGLETLGDFLDSFSSPMAVFNDEGSQKLSNAAFCAMLDADPDAIDGPNLTETLTLLARKGLGSDALLELRYVVAGHARDASVTARIGEHVQRIKATRTARGAIVLTIEPQTQRSLRRRLTEIERPRQTA